MCKKLSMYLAPLGFIVIMLLTGCAAEVPAGSPQNETETPSASTETMVVETPITTAVLSTQMPAAYPLLDPYPVPTAGQPVIPTSARPLLTAPVLPLNDPRAPREVTQEGWDVAPAVVLDPVLAGVPVMPGALNARSGSTYTYSVRRELAEAEAWYLKQMTDLGWKLDLRRELRAEPPKGAGLQLEFTRDGVRAWVILEYSPADQMTRVSLRYGGS